MKNGVYKVVVLGTVYFEFYFKGQYIGMAQTKQQAEQYFNHLVKTNGRT